MRGPRALSRYRFTFLTIALLTVLSLGTSMPAAAAECYLMLYLGSDEQNVVAAGKTLKELEKRELPALDAKAPVYFVLIEDMTMSLVESAGREAGVSKDIAGSTVDSAVEVASEMAATAGDLGTGASGSAAQGESQSRSSHEKFREFIPHEEIGLGFFCPDGSDEGDSWSAPNGRIHALTNGNDLVIGLTKKGILPPV